jgi:hypothetical protein
MEGSPFRERRFAPADVRRILRRAVDAADHDEATAAAEKPLTQEEIERLGGELGLPATAIQRAIAGDAEIQRARVSPWGRRRIAFEDEIDGELPADRHEDVVDAIQASMGDGGRAQVVGRTLTWTPTPQTPGQGRQLTVSVRSRDGKTRVRVEENLSQQFLGLHLGFGLGLGIGLGFGVGFPVALSIGSPLFGIGFWLLAEILSLTIAQIAYRAILRRRTRELSALRERIGDVVRDGIVGGPTAGRARIAGTHTSPQRSTKDEEDAIVAEAEAELEAERARPVGRSGSA